MTDPAPIPTPAGSGRNPRQLGEPATALARIALPIHELPRDVTLFQCFGARGPLNFNPTPAGRFNAPNGEYAATYLSTSTRGAFAETIIQTARRTEAGLPIVFQSQLDQLRLCAVNHRPGAVRLLRLVDLSSEGLVRIGATNELCSLADIGRLQLVQRWALALHGHPQQPDRILYRARHDPACLSIVLFDRARELLEADVRVNYLADVSLLAELCRVYRVALLDDR